MASLRRVMQAMAFWSNRDTQIIHGQFTGANGSVGTILFKGILTIVRTGEGVYDIKLFAPDGVTFLKGFHLKALVLTFINPNAADGGSGVWNITTDTMNSLGIITVTTLNQALAAADIIGVCKVALQISPEAAT